MFANNKIWLLFMVLFLANCTSQMDLRLPADDVMHFPFAIAKKGNTLFVSSTSADGKYDQGRLISFDTTIIESNLPSNKIELSKIIKTNTMIDPDSPSLLALNNYLIFASQKSSKLFAIPFLHGTDLLLCNNKDSMLKDCNNAISLSLTGEDPYSMASLSDVLGLEFLLLSYLDKNSLDLIKIDKSSTKAKLSIHKSIGGSRLLNITLGKFEQLTPRKILVLNKNLPNSKTYILFNKQNKKFTSDASSLLMYADTNNLRDEANIATDILDLKEEFFISEATDFYITDILGKKTLYVLAARPSALYKIDLDSKKLIETSSICSGANIMAISNKHLAYIPCFNEAKVVSIDLDTMQVKAASKTVFRGPVMVLIDEPVANPMHIYVSDYLSGTLMILDESLELLGKVFSPAPSNRAGS